MIATVFATLNFHCRVPFLWSKSFKKAKVINSVRTEFYNGENSGFFFASRRLLIGGVLWSDYNWSTQSLQVLLYMFILWWKILTKKSRAARGDNVVEVFADRYIETYACVWARRQREVVIFFILNFARRIFQFLKLFKNFKKKFKFSRERFLWCGYTWSKSLVQQR